MPLVVKELVVRATIDSKPEPTGGAGRTSAEVALDQRKLIERCAAEVIRILDQRLER